MPPGGSEIDSPRAWTGLSQVSDSVRAENTDRRSVVDLSLRWWCDDPPRNREGHQHWQRCGRPSRSPPPYSKGSLVALARQRPPPARQSTAVNRNLDFTFLSLTSCPRFIESRHGHSIRVMALGNTVKSYRAVGFGGEMVLRIVGKNKSPSLTVSAAVKPFLSRLGHALGEERHFALVEIGQANLGLASNRSGQELSPTQPSLRSQPRS